MKSLGDDARGNLPHARELAQAALGRQLEKLGRRQRVHGGGGATEGAHPISGIPAGFEQKGDAAEDTPGWRSRIRLSRLRG